MDESSGDKTQLQLIKGLITYRLVVISLFLGLLAFFQFEFGEGLYSLPVAGLVASTYLITIVYIFLLKVITRYTLFLYVQLLIDLLIESAIIYCSGGISSPFNFLYIFTIIASSMALSRPAAYFIASAASIFYGLLVNLEFYQFIHPLKLFINSNTPIVQERLFFTVLLHIIAFYLVAFLSDFLAKKVRETVIELMNKSDEVTNLKAFHQNVIEHMGSGFLAVNMGGEVSSWNRAATNILEVNEQDMARATLNNLFGEDAPTILPRASGVDFASQSQITILQTPFKNEKQITINSSPFIDKGGDVGGYIVIFQDVTDIRKREEAMARAEKMASIGRMAGGMAHEIRNPLGAISGSLQMLKNGQGGEKANQKLMSIIMRETDRLNRIISNLLSPTPQSSRSVGGVNISLLIEETVLLFKQDKKYGENLTLNLKLNQKLTTNGDPESLKQIFWNLLINSAQAIQLAGRHGTININLEQAGKGLVIIFTDNGSGIPEEEYMKIFEPFYTTKQDGTGLGLSTVLKIVEEHGGNLEVKSELESGSSFTIYLPLEQS